MNTESLNQTIIAATLLGVAVLLLGWLVYSLLQSGRPGPTLHCCRCEATGQARGHRPGSLPIEIILLLCLLLPGVLYSIWRSAGSRWVCRVCGSEDLIPLHSPRARRMAREQES